MPLMPELKTISQPKVGAYTVLVRRVRETIHLGRRRAEDAVEREKVRTSWEIGKLIHEHILLHKERANYGEQVLKRLSNDLGMSYTEIRYMVEFARTYPIRRPAGELSWGHYQALLRINDDEKRKTMAEEAAEKKWTRQTLRREIGKLKAQDSKAISEFPDEGSLAPIKGTLGTYRIIRQETGPWKGRLVIDLGFSNNHRPSGDFDFRENEIIRVSNSKLVRVKEATEKDLFTYRAFLDEITDGDTLWVVIDLGFGFTTKQHLRLRGIDAPEITSKDGAQAKGFVENELKNVSQIIITSTKSDKYDRYLADVYYLPARNVKIPAGGTRTSRARVYEDKKGEQFLNNWLLKKGLAARV